MDELTAWLLEGPAWVRYRTRIDLLGQTERAAEVRAARQAMLADPQVQGVLAELAEWPGPVLASHKSASHPLHKLTFIADLGLKVGDPGVDAITERILAHQSPEGPFQVLMNISPKYGGTGRDQWAWALCDAPLVVYALLKFGLGKDKRVKAAVQHLAGLVRDNGWPCAVSPELGKFRGPGKRTDPCPIANVYALKALAHAPDQQDCPAARTGAEMLLSHWEHQKGTKYYLFGIGTDFRKLKYPFIWYDLLHVADVLSTLPSVRADARLRAMVKAITAQADAQGRYTAGSMYQAWKGWSFADKKQPSPWLTFLALRVCQRIEP
jgi:hypothetical protein